MAKSRSSGALLLLAICLMSCPLLAFAISSQPNATSPSSERTSSNQPSDTAQTLPRAHILLTTHRSETLRNDPANAFLPHDASHLMLDYGTPEAAADAKGKLWAIEWLDDLHLRRRIHEVTVDGWGSLTNFTSLSSVLGLIDRLDEVHWFNNDPVPAAVLSVLEAKHSNCKLSYHMKFSNWDAHDRTVSPVQPVGDEPHRDVRAKTRQLILGSRNLYSLSTHVGYGAKPDPVSLRLVHQILNTCPNLRILDLSVSHRGCVVSGNQPFAFDFSSRSKLARAPFPPLISLRLWGYNLDGPYQGEIWPPFFTRTDRSQLKWPWHHLPDFILNSIPQPWLYSMEKEYVRSPYPGYPTTFNKTTNVDGWIERVDFSKLNSLDINPISSTSLHKLGPHLTNLTSLTVHEGGYCAVDALEALLRNGTVPLNHLHLYNVDFSSFDDLLEILSSQHGGSLKSFALYEGEQFRRHSCWSGGNQDHPNCTGREDRRSISWYDAHLYLNKSQLQQLHQASPAIKVLDIDLDRNLDAASQADLFDILGSYLNLSKLTLRLESPTFQAVRNGSCVGWDCGFGRAGRQGALEDPMVNTKWVRSVFEAVRFAQASRLYSFGVDTGLKLDELELIVGPWSSRHTNSMTGPDKFVLGRFECNAEPGRSSFDVVGRGECTNCTGELRWPDEYMWDYESDFDFMNYEPAVEL